jgi:PTH1 family peptidyl-tRNA hydrolase
MYLKCSIGKRLFCDVKRKRFAIFGLGNPGKQFMQTRHNIGFDVVDHIAQSYGIQLESFICDSKYTIGTFGPHEIYIAQPQTFMNLSGRAVRGFTDKFKIFHENVIVIYDDLSLSLGSLRVKNRGSSGGQNGIEDVIKHMGQSSRFARLRFGIGSPPPHLNFKEFVLKKFNHEEMKLINPTIVRTKECIEYIMTNGIHQTMTRYNKSFEEFYEYEEQERIKKLQRQKEKEEKEKNLSTSTTPTTTTLD